MAGTTIVAARIALIAAIDALSALDGVSVSYSYVAKLADGGNREFVYGGPKSEADVVLSAMQGGGRVKREESPDWSLHIEVVKPGEITTQAGDLRAVEIGTAIEDYVAANPTLGGTVTGLLKTVITGWSLNSHTDDKQSYSDLDYRVVFDSYLT